VQSPDLTLELRLARPVASPELRERVRAVAAQVESPPEPHVALAPWRRLAFLAAASIAVVAISGALVYGLAHSGKRPESVRARAGGVAAQPRAVGQLVAPLTPTNVGAQQVQRSALPNVPTRLQQYGASLRVQVRDRPALSDATKRAMRYARLLGGYVAYVRYSAPAHGRGAASLIVRVPIGRVQDAVAEYSSLGTILAQNVSIRDVTKAAEEQAKEIARLRAEIARLEAGGVTPAERPRVDADRARLDYLTKRRAATVRRAQLARVALELTTRPKQAAAPASRFHRTMSSAGGVLVRELELLVYALVVAGPLLLLGAAVLAAGRARDRRLFERS
jgi:hypothetical protein